MNTPKKEITYGINEKLKEQFLEAIEQENESWLNENLALQNPIDIAELIKFQQIVKIKFVFFLLPVEFATELLSYFDLDKQEEVLSDLEPIEIAKYLDYFESDDATDLLNCFSDSVSEQVLGFMKDENHAKGIEELLRHHKETAGGLMAKELVKVNISWTVAQCIKEIHSEAEKIDKLFAVYVVDDDNLFLGVLTSKSLLINSSNELVKNIYFDDIPYVETFKKDADVVHIMKKYDLATIAVVNSRKHLLGHITIDDVVDVMQESADESIQIMSGITEDVEHHDTILLQIRSRLPWLIIGIVGGIVAAFFLETFDYILDIRLIFFIPLIMATGGNVGIQSSSITIQHLVTERNHRQSIGKRFLKMFLIAISNGIILGIMVFIFISFFMDISHRIAFIVAISLLAVVFISSIMGTTIPIIFHKIKINPALASGPFITTINDVMGLLVFLWLGYYLLNV